MEDYHTIANDPSTSGIDFFVIGAGYSIGFFGLSIVGFVSSLIAKILNASKIFAVASLIGMLLFSLEFFFAIPLFFM